MLTQENLASLIIFHNDYYIFNKSLRASSKFSSPLYVSDRVLYNVSGVV